MGNVCVIGAGPAGMMAAYSAAENGHKVTLFEKNEKLGKKLYLTGKGRCNITNAAPIENFFESVVRGGNFLYSAFYNFDNMRLLRFFEEFGLSTKTERGGRVFPVSDKSSDVIKALSCALKSAGVHISFNTDVKSLVADNNKISGVVCSTDKFNCDSVIVATGGLSYPSTGCTGAGYSMAKATGHKIIKPCASLVGLDICENVSCLAGLTLKNTGLTVLKSGKRIYNEQGELLFTHTGISGPLVLSASAYIDDIKDCFVCIDLKPALDEKKLDIRLLRDFDKNSNKQFKSVLKGLLPAAMFAIISDKTGIDLNVPVHSITREKRHELRKTLKNLVFAVKAKRPVEEAVITRGGISLLDIDSSTMQSRLCAGLYFAGEVIAADALTGGYNLQIAFSTGYLAGISC